MGVVLKELPVFEQHIPNVERITKNDAAENKFLVLFLMICFFPAVILVESMFSSMTTLTHLSLRGLSPLNNRKADVPAWQGHREFIRTTSVRSFI